MYTPSPAFDADKMPLLSEISGIVLILGILILVVIVSVPKLRRKLDSEAETTGAPKMIFVVTFATFVMIVGGLVTAIVGTCVEYNVHLDAQVKWAVETHGITVDRGDVVDLLQGEERAVAHDGELTRIEFVKNENGGITVFEVTTGKPLEAQ